MDYKGLYIELKDKYDIFLEKHLYKNEDNNNN